MFAELCVKLATEHGIIVSVRPVDDCMVWLCLVLGEHTIHHCFETATLKRYGTDVLFAYHTEKLAEELLNYVEKKRKENDNG